MNATLIIVSSVMTIIMFAVAFAVHFRKVARWQGGIITATTTGIAVGLYGISQNANSVELIVMVVLAVVMMGGMTLIFFRPRKDL